MTQPQDAIRERYQTALASFVAKVQQDSYIIAAILCGSLSHDTVWQKSDIDMLLIGRDEKKPVREYYLVEDGINIHTLIYSRSRFKQALERSLQSSFFHSYFSKSTLLFTTDDTIREYYSGIQQLGAADRDLELLKTGASVPGMLYKAEKWLYIKNDPAYSYLWVMYMIVYIAKIEVLLNNEITGREVVQQAMKFNPTFFNTIYFDLLNRPKDATTVEQVLRAIDSYLTERIPRLFHLVLDYLAEAGGPRTTTELDEYFRKRTQEDTFGTAYEWLADKGVIHKIATALRLTEKSRATVDEAAYFYDGPSTDTAD
jgi:hypothetical protein